MILNFEQLAELRGKVVMVDGGFDPLHFGHVLYFRKAAATGLPVLCNVSADAYVARKHPVLLPQDVRCKVIEEFKSISYVHPSSTSTAEVLEQARPKVFMKGDQWAGALPEAETQACRRHGVEIVFVDTVVDSSSERMSAVMKAIASPPAGGSK